MKWIGQHIFDLIATFRSDLLIGQTEITGSSYKKGIELHSRSNTQPGIELTGDEGSATTGPFIAMTNYHDGDGGTFITFAKNRLGGTAADGDAIATLNFRGDNDNNSLANYACIKASISDASDGNTEGKIQIAASTPGLSAEGLSMTANVITGEGNGSGIVDVTLAAGAASTTTVAGDMTVTGGDITLSGTGRIQGVDTVSASTDAASKAYVDAAAGDGLSFDGSTANGLLTYKDADEITVQSTLTWDASMLTVSSTGDAGEPIIKIHQTQDAVPTTGGELRFDTDRGAGLVGNADDVLGTITWRGHDNQTGGGAAETIYASVVGLIQDPENTLGGEDGKLEFNVLNQNVSNTGLLISPTGTNGHVNATIGKGAAGLVTIEGYLSLGGHNVNDIDITSEASDADDHLMTALAIKNRIEDYNYVTAAVTLTTAAQTNITSLGTLTALDVDNINLNGKVITLTGDTDDTFSIETGGAGATTLTTVDTAGADGHFEIAADGNITLDAAGDIALEAAGGDVTGDAQNYTFTSSVSAKPVLRLVNTNTDANGPELIFDKTNVAGADNDDIGKIKWNAEDNGGGGPHTFGQILGEIAEASTGQAGGKLSLQIASHDGGLENGLILQEGDADAEVDVTIGNGAASTTTVAGDLTVTSKASIPTRKFAIPADGAGNADGDVVYIGTGSTVIGKIYYYKSDGSWGLTNSDDPGTATGWLAVALGTDPDVDGMLVRGTVDLATDIVGTEALGSIIYLDKATTGTATTAAPTATGDIVRVIGYALTTGNANKIWFSPDNTWVEHV